MKRFCVFCKSLSLPVITLLASVLLTSGQVYSQINSVEVPALFLSCNKTTSIIFPKIVKSIDRGSRDLVTQKVPGAENILQLKASKENFTETNLTVITADGKLYSFIVRYANDPSPLNFKLDSAENIFEMIAPKKPFMHCRDESFEMLLRLKGIYIENDILYYQLQVENNSNISYDIDLLRFYIKDKKQNKRTASQELDEIPLSVYGNAGTIPGKSQQTLVVAFRKFTIPDKKHFYVQVMERNGGRNLQLKISNKRIVRARAV